MPLVHHELCFGCGRANLFGLLAEIERRDERTISGRCFLKQDHQGPSGGQAHPGVVACALLEAAAFARGGGELEAAAFARGDGELPRVEIQFHDAAPVGMFLELEATVKCGRIDAAARADGRLIASASVG